MASKEPLLDEIQWSSPEWVQHYNGIHENTVLFYFARSPFCDPTSNNAAIEAQAHYNPSMVHILFTRKDFEGHLRSLQGLEYMVAFCPRDFGGEAPIGQGIWVVRKQNRRKKVGAEDELDVLATYLVVGERIVMAPSVSNIVQARLLTTTQALHKLITTSSSLPYYTPALGHRYFPPTSKSRDAASSLIQSLPDSREGTPIPDAPSTSTAVLDAPASATGGISKPIGAVNAAGIGSANAASELQTLYDSFGQFLHHKGEYMDENPLLGEPGSFVFSSSKQHLLSQQEIAAKKVQARESSTLPQKNLTSHQAKETEGVTVTSRTTSEGPPTPSQGIQAELLAVPPRKGSRDNGDGGPSKAKRRKSKAANTPGSPLSASSLG